MAFLPQHEYFSWGKESKPAWTLQLSGCINKLIPTEGAFGGGHN